MTSSMSLSASLSFSFLALSADQSHLAVTAAYHTHYYRSSESWPASFFRLLLLVIALSPISTVVTAESSYKPTIKLHALI